MSAVASGPAHDVTLLLLAKAPRAGACKTRLAPRYGFDGAARLAAAALMDTLEALTAVPARRRVLVLAGAADDVHAVGFEVAPQVEGSHAERIAAAFELVDGPALLVGMDTPQLGPSLDGFDVSAGVDAWLGGALDGGWWALGLRDAARVARSVLRDVPMSTPHTGRIQRERLLAHGLSVRDLPVLQDVDEPQDALAVAAAAPWTRFARAVAEQDKG